MKYIALLCLAVVMPSSAHSKAGFTPDTTEKENYKNWVLSRCLSYAFPGETVNQDALNSASAYLEQSTLPVEAFVAADPLIKEFLSKSGQGSIPGSFKVKSCIDLFHSAELERLFIDERNKRQQRVWYIQIACRADNLLVLIKHFLASR